jgi:hypothetical protein
MMFDFLFCMQEEEEVVVEALIGAQLEEEDLASDEDKKTARRLLKQTCRSVALSLQNAAWPAVSFRPQSR